MKRFISVMLAMILFITASNIAMPINIFAENVIDGPSDSTTLPEETVQTVCGKIVDGNGNAIENVSVLVYDVDSKETVGTYYTAEDGIWFFQDIIQYTNYSLRYFHPLYEFENDTEEIYVEEESITLPDIVATKKYDEFTDTNESEFTYATTGETSIEIIKYTGTDGIVVIPDTISGYTVESIGFNAFGENTNLTMVVLPKNLKTVGVAAFNGCINLQTVILNDTLADIESSAFDGCTALQDINFPNGLSFIGPYAFYNTGLSEVNLPDSVSDIRDRAFGGCQNLEHFSYPIGWSYTDGTILLNCPKLTQITVPEGVERIPVGAFANIASLREVSLPSTLEIIEQDAFNNCSGLTEITIPPSVWSIGSYAFYGCTGLKEITLPYGLEEIDSWAFSQCTSLKKVQLPNTLTTIGSGAFNGCINLEKINYPMGLQDTDYGDIFRDCDKLTSMTIPEGVTTIPENAFYGANKLQKVVLPVSLTEIGAYAFSSCDTLRKIWIDENVTIIGEEVFSYSPVTIHGKTGTYAEEYATENEIPFSTDPVVGKRISGIIEDESGNAIEDYSVLVYNKTYKETKGIYYTDSSGIWTFDEGEKGETYIIRYYHPLYSIEEDTQEVTVGDDNVNIPGVIATKGYDEFTPSDEADFTYRDVEEGQGIEIEEYTGNDSTVVIPNTISGHEVTRIGTRAFADNENITSVVLPEGIKSIGENAFILCSNLEKVLLNSSLEKIDRAAFAYCTSLGEISFPNSLVKIGAAAFENTCITAVELPDSISTISAQAFKGCKKLEYFKYPIGWQEAGQEIFSNCPKLTQITVPEGITKIPENAFVYASSLKEINLPDTLTSIEEGIFMGCTGLEEMDIPENVTEIKGGAFSNCSGLKEISLPSGITRIGYGAFSYCTGLEEVALPDGVEHLEEQVFYGCTSLSKINYPKNLISAGDYVFKKCSKLTHITVPDGVTQLANSVFHGANYLKTIDLPETLTEIGYSAFEDCVSLNSITLPSNLEYISSNAFRGCESLERVYFPDSVKGIYERAFEDCTSLSSIEYPKGLEEAGDSIFEGCEKLNTIAIPEGVTTIPNDTFCDADYLENISLPDSLTQIGDFAFLGCTALKAISISEKVHTVGDYAFNDCPNLIVYCNENSPAIVQIIDNGVQFAITNEISSYEHFIFEETGYQSTGNSTVGYIPFEVKYKFKDGIDVYGKEVVIKIPQNTEFMEKTLYLKDDLITDYYYDEDERILRIYIDEISPNEGEVSFCVKPIEYDTLLTYAKMEFYEDGKRRDEIIDILNCSVPYLTLKAEDRINSEKVKVEGITAPSAEVDLYVDGVYVKSVNAIKTGKFSATIDIKNPVNYKQYTITAKVTKGSEEKTADAYVKYEAGAPKLESLTMNYRDDVYDFTAESNVKPALTFVSGIQPTYSAKFENPEKIDNVYIVSTRNNQKKYMETEWDEKTKSYVSVGGFEGTDSSYVPGEITVEYTKKRPEVLVTNEIDAANLLGLMHPAVRQCTPNVKTNTATSYEATIDVASELTDLVGDEIQFVCKTIDKEYNDGAIGELMTVGNDIYSYLIKDGAKEYVLTTDWSDPDSYFMVVHDIANNKEIKYALEFIEKESELYGPKAKAISEALGEIGYLTGTIKDVYDIENDDENLRRQIMRSGMTAEERQIALKKAKELKRDREAFLATTMIISVATMGLGGPSAIAFGLLYGAITASSSFFWDARMANILGGGFGFSCKWAIDPSGYVYEGTTDNRLEGVTATAYWIAPEYIDEDGNGDESMAVLWDASEYEQMNPLITDENGQYAWDVPEGLWQVVFEKEGYETAYSEWLPVPPPQTEVHMGMVSYEEPKISSMEWSGDTLSVVFSKHIMPSTIENIEILNENKEPLSYTVSYDETLKNLEGKNFAKVFEFVMSGEPYFIKVNSEVKSYADVGMNEDIIKVDKIVSQFDVDTKTVTLKAAKAFSNVSVWATSYKEGRAVSIKSSQANLTAGTSTVVFNELDITDADTVKIMVWENAPYFKPLCDACVVELD